VVPPRPAGEAPEPAKKGKGPAFWIGTGCCGCLTLLLLMAALFGGGIYFMSKGPVEAVRAQLTELKGGQVDAAYERLSQSYQSVLSREDFERLVAAHPSLRDNADSTFTSRNVQMGTAQISGKLTAASGEEEKVTYALVKESEAWKISGINFEGDVSVPPLETSP
jgi:hypothetical protein